MVETPLPDTGAAPFAEADPLLPLTDDDERCLLEGVGWVGPVIWWVGLGSDMSTGRSEALVELEEWEVLLATEADRARRAVSSRVRRLT